MEWHIVTGEYPPKLGGVSDYTSLLARALAEAEEIVHIWTAGVSSSASTLRGVKIHTLPSNFGLHWLKALHNGLSAQCGHGTVLIQYVPHMYGWKAMNIAFCCWLAMQRKKRIWVMFHEVAYPFKRGQPFKHDFLAIVHRLMACMVARSAKRSFTSIEPYQALLRRLAPNAQIDLLRLFSNVPFEGIDDAIDRKKLQLKCARPIVGIFSSFNNEICELLDATLPVLLQDSAWHLLLVGPGAGFIHRLVRRFPKFEHRLHTSGRVSPLQAGPYIKSCDVLLQLYPEGACGARGTFIAALASGVPVITTAGHLTEPLFNSAAAFADHDPRVIRRVLEDLLGDKTAARNLGAAGRRLYEEHFDLAVAVGALTGGLPSTAVRATGHSA